MTTTWRIRDRTTFAELRRHGRRARSGSLTLTWLPGESLPGESLPGEALPGAASQPPRVAYAVGRSVGPAVVRNRVRRRLRAAVAEVAPALPPGAYLVGAAPGAARASYQELRTSLGAALQGLEQGPSQEAR